MRSLKECILSLLLVLTAVPVLGQRMTDRLDRGLVAVQTEGGVYCSWRVLAEEYYDLRQEKFQIRSLEDLDRLHRINQARSRTYSRCTT